MINIAGQRFGRLIVLSFAGKNKWGKVCWNCLCDCGTTKVIRGGSLPSGNTKSCGCLNREITRKINKIHGETIHNAVSKEYQAWINMKRRCFDPISNRYKYYGGRGITVCDRWLNNFKNFLSDVGRAPSTKFTIDRIDNDGNYEPRNVQWSTPKQQANNRQKRFR